MGDTIQKTCEVRAIKAHCRPTQDTANQPKPTEEVKPSNQFTLEPLKDKELQELINKTVR